MPVHPPQRSCDALIAAIREELRRGLARAEAAVYKQRVITYWHIGRHIDKFLAADPGSDAVYLSVIAGRLDYSPDVVRKILKFYRCFPKLPKVPPLSWSQYRALLTAPAAQRSLLLKRAITEDIGADELYALISVSRHHTPAVSGAKLEYKRGKLFIYKTLQGKHLKLKKGEIMVDGGFKWRHKVKACLPAGRAGAGSKLTGGHIVRSVKTEKGDYKLKHCNDDPSSLYTYKAEVERVVDADTFLLTIDTGFDNWLGSRVRLPAGRQACAASTRRRSRPPWAGARTAT